MFLKSLATTGRSPAAPSFREDERGTVAIIFCLALTCLMGFAALAIDYSRGVDIQAKLQQIADTAALAAAKDPDYSSTQATEIAHKFLAANGMTVAGGLVPVVTINRSVGASTDVTVRVQADLPSTFMNVFGISKMSIAADSKAGIELSDTEIYAAVDMSESLGIAADPAARAALQALTAPYLAATANPEGCEFACHKRDGWEPGALTVHQMAKTAGIALREDVLEAAFGKFVDDFMDPADPDVANNRKRMGVIGFSDAAQLLLSPTNDAAAIKNAPATFPDANRFNTLFDVAMPQIKTMVGEQGTGKVGSPKKTLVLITDGMGWDRTGNFGAGNGPINQVLCESIKDAGITLAVIDVKFQDATGEHWFDLYASMHYPAVSPALQTCASPGYYFQAEDSDMVTLSTAFKEVSQSLQSKLALKN
ncbi:MAG: pilus assembly protein TadG-related protein [Hyphomicrobium sp.]